MEAKAVVAEKDSFKRINHALRLYGATTQEERAYWSGRIERARLERIITNVEAEDLRKLIVR